MPKVDVYSSLIRRTYINNKWIEVSMSVDDGRNDPPGYHWLFMCKTFRIRLLTDIKIWFEYKRRNPEMYTLPKEAWGWNWYSSGGNTFFGRRFFRDLTYSTITKSWRLTVHGYVQLPKFPKIKNLLSHNL